MSKRNSLLIVSPTNNTNYATLCKSRSKREIKTKDLYSRYNISKKVIDASPLYTNDINGNNFMKILAEYKNKNKFLFNDTSEDIEFFKQIKN